MAEVIPQINIDGTKIKNTWTEKEYVTDEVYNALNKAVIDLKNNNNLLDSNSILFREEYNLSSKDLNNAIHQGVYSFTNSAVNAPSGVNGGNLLVTNTSKTNQGSSIITQIAFCHNGAVYARTKNTSEDFTSWNKLAYITDNVASATKATQDSQGQQINTTYVKGLSANNATLTVTKGNGSTSTITVNNVSRAECSDRVGANAGYSNNTKASGLKGGLSQSAIYDNGFPFAHGNLISVKNSGANQIALEWSGTTGAVGMVAVRNARDVGIDTWSAWRYLAYTESPAFSGTPTAPTPSTSDNGTRVATTAFVQSLLSSRFTASKQENGWWRDGNTGMIFQFFSYKPTTNYKDAIMPAINFPISFPNKCILVLPVLYNDDKTVYHDITMQPVSTTNSSVIFYSQLHGPDTLQNITGTTIKALAIGY